MLVKSTSETHFYNAQVFSVIRQFDTKRLSPFAWPRHLEKLARYLKGRRTLRTASQRKMMQFFRSYKNFISLLVLRSEVKFLCKIIINKIHTFTSTIWKHLIFAIEMKQMVHRRASKLCFIVTCSLNWNSRYRIFLSIYFYITLKRKQFVRCKENIVQSPLTIWCKYIIFAKRVRFVEEIFVTISFATDGACLVAKRTKERRNCWREFEEGSSRKKEERNERCDENVPYPHSIRSFS